MTLNGLPAQLLLNLGPLSGLLKYPYYHYEEAIPIPEAEQDFVAQELAFHEAVERYHVGLEDGWRIA